MIRFSKPSFGEREVSAAAKVILSGQCALGDNVKRFEEEFANYIKAPYVVAVDSCTNALFLSLKFIRACDIGCPSMTFASVPNMVRETGHALRFTDKYFAGYKYVLEGTNIWDCAHELRRGIYEPGTVQCFSFYPNKILGSVEGGAIAADNERFARWARLARANGRTSESFWDYSIEFIGWNCYMNNLQAEVARVQLRKLDDLLEKRRRIRDYYNEMLNVSVRSLYLYIIRVRDRREFIRKMYGAGIETSVHYKPVHLQPAYIGTCILPKTESIAPHIVSIPLYPSLKDEEIEYVAKKTKEFL